MRRRADAREHQQLRRVEGAAGEDDLLARFGVNDEAVLHIFHARRMGAAHDHARHLRAHIDGQVGALADGVQIGDGGGRALAIADRILAAAEALVLLTIVIVGHGQTCGPRGLDPGVEERIAGRGELHLQGAIAAAPGVAAIGEAFAAFEIGENVRVGPALAALLRPAVIVAAMAARIGHHIDGGGAAEHLAARGLDGAVVQIGLGLRMIAPVVHAILMHLAHAERNVNERVKVAPARLDEQNRGAFVLGQPIGEHAARRTRAHNDVIVASPHHHLFPLESLRRRGRRLCVCVSQLSLRARSSRLEIWRVEGMRRSSSDCFCSSAARL